MNKVAKKIILSVISLSAVLGTSALAADLSGWAVSDYQQANEAGLVSYSVVSNNLRDNITREEFCELVVNLYEKLTGEDMIEPEVSVWLLLRRTATEWFRVRATTHSRRTDW